MNPLKSELPSESELPSKLKENVPPSSTLLTGGSNLVRMQGDFNERQPGFENSLAKYKFDVLARLEFRALFLG